MKQDRPRENVPDRIKGLGGRWASLRRRLRTGSNHQCNDLLPSKRVFKHLNLKASRDLGWQSVPIDKIVGSSGRYLDFDLSFRPRRSPDARWMRLARLRDQGVRLPPVALVKIGDAYFVEDGNHRISVSQAQGQQTIMARVIELDASSLQREPSCERLGYRI
jgi:hypothetical protein